MNFSGESNHWCSSTDWALILPSLVLFKLICKLINCICITSVTTYLFSTILYIHESFSCTRCTVESKHILCLIGTYYKTCLVFLTLQECVDILFSGLSARGSMSTSQFVKHEGGIDKGREPYWLEIRSGAADWCVGQGCEDDIYLPLFLCDI